MLGITGAEKSIELLKTSLTWISGHNQKTKDLLCVGSGELKERDYPCVLFADSVDQGERD